jgi:hypothetical protein
MPHILFLTLPSIAAAARWPQHGPCRIAAPPPRPTVAPTGPGGTSTFAAAAATALRLRPRIRSGVPSVTASGRAEAPARRPQLCGQGTADAAGR